MEREPFENEPASATRKLAADLAIANANRHLELAVRRMEVRRIMISVQDRDGDAEKA